MRTVNPRQLAIAVLVVGLVVGTVLANGDVARIATAVVSLAAAGVALVADRIRARQRRRAAIAKEARAEGDMLMASLPFGGRQAEALAPFVGMWVALGKPDEVLAAAESPDELVRELRRRQLRAEGGLLRVPVKAEEAQGAAPQ